LILYTKLYILSKIQQFCIEISYVTTKEENIFRLLPAEKRRSANMNKQIIFSAAAIIAFAACSDDKSSTPSTGTELTEKEVVSLSEADIAFMTEALNANGNNTAIISNDAIDLHDSSLTQEPVIMQSPVRHTFTTQKNVVFSEINNQGTCWVNLYNEENGISFYKSMQETIPGSTTILQLNDERTILLKENEGSLYRQDLLYKTNAGKLDRCIADSIAFISECNEKGGIYKIYSKECSPQTTLEASCIAKVSNETTLKTIANTLKAECEAFVTNLPEAEPIPTVHCQGDSENGMTCDTTWNQ